MRNALIHTGPTAAAVELFPSFLTVGQERLQKLPEARTVPFDPGVTELVENHVIEVVNGHGDKPQVQGDPSFGGEAAPTGFHRADPQDRQRDVLWHPQVTGCQAFTKNHLCLTTVPTVKEFPHVLGRRFSLRRDADAPRKKPHRGLLPWVDLDPIHLTEIRVRLSARVPRLRRFRGRPRLQPSPRFEDPKGMLENEFPNRLRCRTHRGSYEHGEIRVDGDAEGPAPGTSKAVMNIGRAPRHEVRKAFGHAGAVPMCRRASGRVPIHGRII